VEVGDPKQEGRAKLYPIRMTPRDALGNVVGPGRSAKLRCTKPCACDNKNVVDQGDGSYTIMLRVPDGNDLSSCDMDAFGARFLLGKRARFPGREDAKR
jgi:hypothetical protein